MDARGRSSRGERERATAPHRQHHYCHEPLGQQLIAPDEHYAEHRQQDEHAGLLDAEQHNHYAYTEPLDYHSHTEHYYHHSDTKHYYHHSDTQRYHHSHAEHYDYHSDAECHHHSYSQRYHHHSNAQRHYYTYTERYDYHSYAERYYLSFTKRYDYSTDAQQQSHKKNSRTMKASELVLAADGSLYHIRLKSSTLADKVLLVGDPGRVNMFKEIFDSVEFESENREMHALTGSYHGTRMTALSTGMGCDNIDIVMTELDAAANVDIETSRLRDFKTTRRLEIVRIGTSGSLQEDVDCGSHVATAYAIGLDGLMNYYKEWEECRECKEMEEAFVEHMGLDERLARPYCVRGSELLIKKIAPDMHQGITATAPGFYGPQGRTVRLHPAIENLNEKLASFTYAPGLKATPSSLEGELLRVTNLEMETSAIYGFSKMMGHEALTVCLIIANRVTGRFLNDYHREMRELVGRVVERMV